VTPRSLAPVLLVCLLRPATADERFDFGFSEGLHPIELGEGGHKAADPARCGTCHAQQYTDWHQSRHRVAHSNAIYQAGLIAEPQPFCVHCHSPDADQSAEVLQNLDWYRAQDPRESARGATSDAKKPETSADHGIHCAVCHFRDGQVLAPEVNGRAPHASTAVREMLSGDFCAGCHQFRMPAFHNGALSLTDVEMQSTWSEWTAWGGKESCQDCHMPDGRHLFRGAHDRQWLKQSVLVKAKLARETATFRMRSLGVGHHFPSGDLFRNLTLELKTGDDWAVIDRIGREFTLVMDEQTTEVSKELSRDTALRPGEWREVSTPAVAGQQWRLRYHYGSENDEHRGLLDPEEIVLTLLEGSL